MAVILQSLAAIGAGFGGTLAVVPRAYVNAFAGGVLADVVLLGLHLRAERHDPLVAHSFGFVGCHRKQNQLLVEDSRLFGWCQIEFFGSLLDLFGGHPFCLGEDLGQLVHADTLLRGFFAGVFVAHV